MNEHLYFVYALDANGELKGEKRVTDADHLDICVKYVCHDFGVTEARVNKAAMCFDGYLVQGDYIGVVYLPKEINYGK